MFFLCTFENFHVQTTMLSKTVSDHTGQQKEFKTLTARPVDGDVP